MGVVIKFLSYVSLHYLFFVAFNLFLLRAQRNALFVALAVAAVVVPVVALVIVVVFPVPVAVAVEVVETN